MLPKNLLDITANSRSRHRQYIPVKKIINTLVFLTQQDPRLFAQVNNVKQRNLISVVRVVNCWVEPKNSRTAIPSHSPVRHTKRTWVAIFRGALHSWRVKGCWYFLVLPCGFFNLFSLSCRVTRYAVYVFSISNLFPRLYPPSRVERSFFQLLKHKWVIRSLSFLSINFLIISADVLQTWDMKTWKPADNLQAQ